VTIKNLHFRVNVERHSSIPYLWRGRCYCGLYFMGASEESATNGLNAHIEEEEPFPHDMTPETPNDQSPQ